MGWCCCVEMGLTDELYYMPLLDVFSWMLVNFGYIPPFTFLNMGFIHLELPNT